MTKLLQFPTDMVIDDIPVKIARFHMSQFEEAHQLYAKAYR